MVKEDQGTMKRIQKAKPQKTKGKAANQKKDIKKLKEELETIKDQYLRVLAEFDNYKKRRERDFIAMRDNANVALIEELLPILDDFERSLNTKGTKRSLKLFIEGTELIFTKLKSMLERQGLMFIDSVEKPFDPELHEAIMQIEDKNHPPNTVIEDVVKGYMLRDRVIRHSKVIVSK